MKRKTLTAVGFLTAFVLWTLAVKTVDVQAIGPGGSAVGFATVNGWFHRLTGVHMTLYTITDWLGLVPVAVGFGFAILGLAQWIKRKSLWKVDWSLLVLGGFYLVILAAYIFFEIVVINYRPVILEASYPSSHTMLSIGICTTAIFTLHELIKDRKALLIVADVFCVAVALTVLLGRLLSGVHWLTDIVGGVLLSAGLVMMYYAVSNLK